MNFIKRVLHAHIAAHSQIWFPWEETGSQIFRTLIQKVKFATLPLFPAHIFSLVAIPRKHGVWQSSRYTSWISLKPSFLILPKWCLKGLGPECLGKAAKGQSWWGEQVLLPPSHLALENQCRSRESHLTPGIFVSLQIMDRRSYLPCRRGALNFLSLFPRKIQLQGQVFALVTKTCSHRWQYKLIN